MVDPKLSFFLVRNAYRPNEVFGVLQVTSFIARLEHGAKFRLLIDKFEIQADPKPTLDQTTLTRTLLLRVDTVSFTNSDRTFSSENCILVDNDAELREYEGYHPLEQ